VVVSLEVRLPLLTLKLRAQLRQKLVLFAPRNLHISAVGHLRVAAVSAHIALEVGQIDDVGMMDAADFRMLVRASVAYISSSMRMAVMVGR